MPPVPGWLREGLWVVERVSDQLFEVTKVTRSRVTMVCRGKDRAREFRLDYLHEYCVACNYFQCDDCRRRSVTCDDCARRATQFSTGTRSGGLKVCDLPKLCSRKFVEGIVPLNPFEEPAGAKEPLPPTRFEREWVI
jgi:hypothetical protein